MSHHNPDTAAYFSLLDIYNEKRRKHSDSRFVSGVEAALAASSLLIDHVIDAHHTALNRTSTTIYAGPNSVVLIDECFDGEHVIQASADTIDDLANLLFRMGGSPEEWPVMHPKELS